VAVNCSRGTREEGPGPPGTDWRSTIKKDVQKMDLAWEQAEVAALDRQEWH